MDENYNYGIHPLYLQEFKWYTAGISRRFNQLFIPSESAYFQQKQKKKNKKKTNKKKCVGTRLAHASATSSAARRASILTRAIGARMRNVDYYWQSQRKVVRARDTPSQTTNGNARSRPQF